MIAALMGAAQCSTRRRGRRSPVPDRGSRDLPNAIALNSSLFNASRIFGPARGGVMIALRRRVSASRSTRSQLRGRTRWAPDDARRTSSPARATKRPPLSWGHARGARLRVARAERLLAVLLTTLVVSTVRRPTVLTPPPVLARDAACRGAHLRARLGVLRRGRPPVGALVRGPRWRDRRPAASSAARACSASSSSLLAPSTRSSRPARCPVRGRGVAFTASRRPAPRTRPALGARPPCAGASSASLLCVQRLGPLGAAPPAGSARVEARD